MNLPGLPTLRTLQHRLVSAGERVRAIARAATKSGMVENLTLRGALATVASLGSPNTAEIYRVIAANAPAKTGVYWRDESLSFREIDARMDRIAGSLKRRGFGRAKSVLLLMKNRPEFLLMQGGATRRGVAAVSVSWRSTAIELSFIAEHSGAVGICFEAEFWPVVEAAANAVPAIAANLIVAGAPAGEAPPGCTRFEDLLAETTHFVPKRHDADDASVVVYTSGTTGKPKGAVRKFDRGVLPAAMCVIGETPMRVDDIHIVPSPLYHSTAFGFLALAHLLGCSAVLLDEFKPETFLAGVQRFRATTTAVVPTMLHRILALGPEALARYDTQSLRMIISCGAPLSGPLARETMDSFGDILWNFYGATETGLVTLASPRDLRDAPGTIGRAIPGNEIRLLDDGDEEVPPGAVGELYVRNQLLVAGYHHDAEATRASMRGGFFSVGDLARRDAEGRYFLAGRKRDLIISGGVNVYPAEVEAVLEVHPAVAEAAVVGIVDAEWGERVVAFVVRRPGASLEPDEAKVWARERLAAAKVPREFVFVDALPRNATGKVLKGQLRDWRDLGGPPRRA